MDAPLELHSFGAAGPLPAGRPVTRENPARVREIVGQVGTVDAAGLDSVVAGAAGALPAWRATPLPERAARLSAAAAAVQAAGDDLGVLLARELGKVLPDCRGEAAFARLFVEYVLGIAPEVLATTEVDDDQGRLAVARQPYGVVAAIVPWNAPLILAMLKVAPALTAGNVIVVKPSPLAPLAVTRALALFAAHLPPGVLSVVHGDAAVGDRLVGHPDVRKVAFTGGTATGRAVMRRAADTVKPVVLELGGNDPAVFLDDFEPDDAAMERAVFGTFLTAGQVCMAAKRLYVHERVAGAFVDAYRAAADRVLVVGDPLDDTVTLGPLASAAGQAHVRDLVEQAAARGATVHTLGTVAPGTDLEGGYFLRPTLVTGVDDDDAIVADEQFGPTVPLLTFRDEDDVVRRANAGEAGLASSVWSADEDRAFALARRLECGTTFVNCHNRAGMALRAPFGGWKQSGFGREFGPAGLAEYAQTHAINLPAAVRSGELAGNRYPGT